MGEWRESAPFWAKHAASVRVMFAPLTAALVEAAKLKAGQSVLDVAGGSGEPSISIAEEVGPSGRVTYTDAVAEMAAAARNESALRGRSNISFVQCRAEALPFPGDSFDVITCRLGIMLFPDPEAAAREMLRVVRPGQPAACAVWDKREVNPFFHVVMEVVSRYIESPPEDPDAPGAFRFAEPGKLAKVFRECGAARVIERQLDFNIEAPLGPGEFWDLRCELSDTLRAKAAALRASRKLESVAREVEQAARAFFAGGRMRFPARALIVTALKQH